ncbi:DUF6417 family protein [Streptomyces sp. QH1-20]|uniref:DUF6417 family protein n=1 Tax=Streptomyces sp. QH1-20 TaxID=3240934 RepID=UPI0035113F2D
MGVLKDPEYQDLAALRDGQDRQQHGWATDTCGIDPRIVDRLLKIGLCEMANADTLLQLRPGPPQWAARPTPEGHDTLGYLPARRFNAPSARSTHARPEATREVELRPKALEAVRLYLSLASDLRQPPAPGLADAVEAAQRAASGSGWLLHLPEPQVGSVAYALWLEARAHSVGPANRLAREYDSQYKPTSRSS